MCQNKGHVAADHVQVCSCYCNWASKLENYAGLGGGISGLGRSCAAVSFLMWLFLFQAQDKIKFLCVEKVRKKNPSEELPSSLSEGCLSEGMAPRVQGRFLPCVSGWMERRCLVKSIMFFRGPPSALCARWWALISERGMKRFVIRTNWTSTWEVMGSKGAWLEKDIDSRCHIRSSRG